MKKAISLLFTLALVLCAVQTSAFADIIADPRPAPPENGMMLPILIISLAIIVVAIIVWRVRSQKK